MRNVIFLTTGIGFLFKKNKISHISGAASFVDEKTITVSSSEGDKKITAKNFIIATGSTSIEIPSIPISNTKKGTLNTQPWCGTCCGQCPLTSHVYAISQKM
jgi:pyruvate/2-oxoglutarate dehydrogenase complex dihydrolipoamide dehydrogenase (E3) component